MMLVALVGGLSSASTAAPSAMPHRPWPDTTSLPSPGSPSGGSVTLLDVTKTAVQPHPLPTGHPGVAFGATWDETWLWDPQRAQGTSELADKALRVRTDQIATRPADQEALSCPPA
jgi:hypothetical protein